MVRELQSILDGGTLTGGRLRGDSAENEILTRKDVDITPEITSLRLIDNENNEVYEVESIDLLQRQFDIRVLAQNIQNLTSFAVIATRAGATTQLSTTTINEIVNGINIKTLTFTASDITSLRAGSGGITLGVIGMDDQNQPVALGDECIGIQPKVKQQTINDAGFLLASQQAWNALPNKSGAYPYEPLNGNIAIVTGQNAVISFENSNVNLNLIFKIQNTGINFAEAQDVNIIGNLFPSNGDLINLKSVGNDFYLIKIDQPE